jgi:Fe-S-cluster-containing dehydrogenase component
MREYIVANVSRCLGCHACEIACKQENRLPPGVRIVEVVQVGPAEVGGVTRMDYVPKMKGGCSLCSGRPAGPACVETCPTGALALCDDFEALQLLYGGGRHQISRFPIVRGGSTE